MRITAQSLGPQLSATSHRDFDPLSSGSLTIVGTQHPFPVAPRPIESRYCLLPLSLSHLFCHRSTSTNTNQLQEATHWCCEDPQHSASKGMTSTFQPRSPISTLNSSYRSSFLCRASPILSSHGTVSSPRIIFLPSPSSNVTSGRRSDTKMSSPRTRHTSAFFLSPAHRP